MTQGELLDNITRLVIFYFYSNDDRLKPLPYKRKFSRESNFRYFRERFENAKICLHEKLYLKRKF